MTAGVGVAAPEIAAVEAVSGAIGVRMTPVVVFAAATAALMAWTLRDNARYLPTAPAPLPALLMAAGHGHGAGDGYTPPAPITGDPLVNYVGLAFLALHLMIAAVAAAAWLVRKSRKDSQRVGSRLLFALLAAAIAAAVTFPVAAITLGSAIPFTATAAAAGTVLQYGFVLAVAGAALLGVP